MSARALLDRRGLLAVGTLAAMAPGPAVARAEPARDGDAGVRDAAYQFADACMRRDRTGFTRLWADNGIWSIEEPHPARAVGRAEIVGMLDTLLAQWSFFVQQVHGGIVRIEGARARARFSLSEFARASDGRPYRNHALYEDALVHDGTTWRFASRRFVYLWLDETTPISGRTFAPPANLAPL